jgi:hypothetical protein
MTRPEACGIALVGIVLREREHFVDVLHEKIAKFTHQFAVVARHSNGGTTRPPLNHRVHHVRVDDVIGQGAGRIGGILCSRGDHRQRLRSDRSTESKSEPPADV